MSVPQYFKAEGAGVLRPLACKAPHMVLAEEARETPNFDRTVGEVVATLPPIYADHPVVQSAAPRAAVPLALFLDGVEYSKRNSIIGFCLINVATGKRELLCSIRKSVLCKCGCGGWDSLRAMFAGSQLELPCLSGRGACERNARG